MNTIIINSDFICNIGYDKYKVKTVDYFCFEKFKIVCPEYKKRIIVELENGTKIGKARIYCGIPDRILSVEWDFKNHEYDFNESQAITNNCVIPGEKVSDEQEKFEYFMNVKEVLDICYYIMTANRDKNVKKRKTSKSIENKSNSNRRQKICDKKVYLLDEIVEYVNENDLTAKISGMHTINCPCWSVRGHYRHYKSGKVVFVKSYEKGKEKGKTRPKDKVYMI